MSTLDLFKVSNLIKLKKRDRNYFQVFLSGTSFDFVVWKNELNQPHVSGPRTSEERPAGVARQAQFHAAEVRIVDFGVEADVRGREMDIAPGPLDRMRGRKARRSAQRHERIDRPDGDLRHAREIADRARQQPRQSASGASWCAVRRAPQQHFGGVEIGGDPRHAHLHAGLLGHRRAIDRLARLGPFPEMLVGALRRAQHRRRERERRVEEERRAVDRARVAAAPGPLPGAQIRQAEHVAVRHEHVVGDDGVAAGAAHAGGEPGVAHRVFAGRDHEEHPFRRDAAVSSAPTITHVLWSTPLAKEDYWPETR